MRHELWIKIVSVVSVKPFISVCCRCITTVYFLLTPALTWQDSLCQWKFPPASAGLTLSTLTTCFWHQQGRITNHHITGKLNESTTTTTTAPDKNTIHAPGQITSADVAALLFYWDAALFVCCQIYTSLQYFVCHAIFIRRLFHFISQYGVV